MLRKLRILFVIFTLSVCSIWYFSASIRNNQNDEKHAPLSQEVSPAVFQEHKNINDEYNFEDRIFLEKKKVIDIKYDQVMGSDHNYNYKTNQKSTTEKKHPVFVILLCIFSVLITIYIINLKRLGRK